MGDLVDVQLLKAADGSLLAKEIRRFATPPPPPMIDFKGKVEIVGQDGLTVSGARFAVDAHTTIVVGDHPGTFADVKVGQTVELKAMPRPDLPPLAIGIHVEL